MRPKHKIAGYVRVNTVEAMNDMSLAEAHARIKEEIDKTATKENMKCVKFSGDAPLIHYTDWHETDLDRTIFKYEMFGWCYAVPLKDLQ